MELSKKKLEDLISAVDKIVAANSQQEPSLFDELSAPTDIAKILDVPIQDPEKSYDLYYGNIQKFLNSFLPKDNEISKPIRELVCILLSHKEKDKKGIRHGTRVRDNILKSKEQKNIQPTKGGHKMVTCQNYVSLFYRQITSCPSDGGIS